MDNPEQGQYSVPEITREQAERLVLELSDAAEEVRHVLINHARHSVLDNPTDYYPDETSRLKRAVNMTRGLPIEGRTDSTAYFFEQGGVFKKAAIGLPAASMPHYFRGVIHDLDEVHLPELNGYTKQLCLAIAPLDRLMGWRFDSQMDSYYKRLGRVNMLRHPFDKEDHQGEVLYISVTSTTNRGIYLLDEWKVPNTRIL